MKELPSICLIGKVLSSFAFLFLKKIMKDIIVLNKHHLLHSYGIFNHRLPKVFDVLDLTLFDKVSHDYPKDGRYLWLVAVLRKNIING